MSVAKLLESLGALCLAALSASCLFGQTNAQTDRRQAALVFEQQGRTAEAEAAWKAIAADSPNDAESYAHLGLLEARQEHFKEAIADYRRALTLDPQMQSVRINLGLSLFKSGELKESIQTFEPMLKIMPGSSPQRPRLVALVGLAHYGLGNYAAAVPFLKQAVTANPGNLEFRLMLAHSCLWSKQYPCVLDEYREIIAINPGAAEAYMLAGEAYDELRQDTNAIEQFQAAVKADPKTPNVHFGYGYLLWRLRRFAEAETEFRAELANDPDHPLALAYLGDVEIHLQHNDEALPYLEHAIRIDPSIALAHLDLGTVYEGQAHKDDALREYQLAAKLNPEDENVHWRLGRLYQSLGRRDEARTELEKTHNLQKVRDKPLVEQISKPSQRPAGPSGDPDQK